MLHSIRRKTIKFRFHRVLCLGKDTLLKTTKCTSKFQETLNYNTKNATNFSKTKDNLTVYDYNIFGIGVKF